VKPLEPFNGNAYSNTHKIAFNLIVNIFCNGEQ